MLTAQERKMHKEAAAAKQMRERCWFTFANGKRCSMPRTVMHDSFCAHHANVEDQDSHNQMFGSQIIRPGDRLDNARAVNTYLTRVACLAAASRITPRHAATLGYIGSLLVCTLAHIRKQDEASANQASAEAEDAAPALDMNFLNLLREKIEQMPDRPVPMRRDGGGYSFVPSSPEPTADNAPQSVAPPPNPAVTIDSTAAPSNSSPQSTAASAPSPLPRGDFSPEESEDDVNPLEEAMLRNLCLQLGVPIPPALAQPPPNNNGHRAPRGSLRKRTLRPRAASG